MRRILPALAALVAVGCGYVGEPLPPLANIPARVADLTATQRGARLIVQFTVPQLTTEGIAIKAPLQLDLRAGLGGEPFQEEQWVAGARKVPEGPVESGRARYEIPAAEWTGRDVVLGVRVTGSNAKQSAWSNFAVIPVVAPPDIPTGVSAENTIDGVRLTWRASGNAFRVFRRAGDAAYAPVADTPQPPWTDSTTQFGQRYGYQVQTIVKLGESREAQSEPSAEITISPQDTFPPAAPAGLHAVEAPNSIELSWDRNIEPDLAGYRVYRTAVGGPFQKIADVDTPTYSDRNIEHGKTYRYEVTAIDRLGNESPHSAPTEAAFQ
jgi:hypothetical protein